MNQYVNGVKTCWYSMTRQARSVSLIVLVVVLLLFIFSVVWPGKPELTLTNKYEVDLAQKMMRLLQLPDQLARVDEQGYGYVYAIDVGYLMQYAAVAENKEMYELLHGIVDEHLLVVDTDNQFVDGFVAWRYPTQDTLKKHGWGEKDSDRELDVEDNWQNVYKPRNKANEPLDASGTTEALKIAEALWIGGHVFKREEDKQLAKKILDGYTRHQYVDKGVWLVRNYYNLQTNAFAENSFTIDYDPDILAVVGEAYESQDLKEVSEKSVDLLNRAKSPAGLIHSLVQPEIVTLMSPLPGPYFSPNNVEQISNVVVVAENCAHQNRKLSKSVLVFCKKRLRHLNLFYNVSDGNSEGWYGVGVQTYAPLIRLAIVHNDRDVFEKNNASFFK